MTRSNWTPITAALIFGISLAAGCAQTPVCDSCQTVGAVGNTGGCDSCQTGCDSCQTGCDPAGAACDSCGRAGLFNKWRGWWYAKFRSHAIPEQLPLGVIQRAHYQAMQTNGEAADFILYRHDFVLSTAELTPDGKDKLLEISARMRSAPFPVLIERSENNSNPELDSFRRNLIAQILTDLGNPDADQRTIVSPAYGPGYNSIESRNVWYRHIYSGMGNNNGGFGGGFGGGGFGGGGFGGGGFGGGGGGFF